MGKRGQVAAFLLMGILVLLLSGLVVFFGKGRISGNELKQDSLLVERYITSCLEKGLLEAEDLGLRDELVPEQEKIVARRIGDCFDSSLFRGINAKPGEPVADVTLSDNSFGVVLDYPVLISGKNSRIVLDRFSAQFSREIPIGFDGDGLVIVSPDRKAELEIGAGNVVASARLRIVDSGFENRGSETVVGGVSYALYPKDADVSGSVLTLKYSEANLRVSEESLVLARYSDDLKVWEPLASTVDPASNRVSAGISKLGVYSVVYGWMGEDVPESVDFFESRPPENIPVMLENCFSGKLEAFPVKGRSSFMNDWGFSRVQGKHEGTDIMAAEGSEIVAAVSGKITDRYCNNLGGNAIEIKGIDGVFYYYAHMSRFGNFAQGDSVRGGDVIGYVGTTIGCDQKCDSGLCGIPGKTIPHLHFGIYLGWKNPRNPYCALVESKSGQQSDSNVKQSGKDVDTGSGLGMVVKDTPHKGGKMGAVKGVIIHSTRGGQVPGKELQATVNWFSNPSSKVSAHRAVGVNGEHYKFVDDGIQAWHAGEHNPYYLGIELEQGKITDSFTDKQYEVAARIVREWSKKYGFEVNRNTVLGHEETSQGKGQGKSDPGPMFDWNKFMSMV